MVVEAATKPVPDHGPFVHLSTDHHGAATAACIGGSCLRGAQGRGQKAGSAVHYAQGHAGAVVTASVTVQTIKTAMAPQTHRCRQDHRFVDIRCERRIRPPDVPDRACGGCGSHDGRCGCACGHGTRKHACAYGWCRREFVWSWRNVGARPVVNGQIYQLMWRFNRYRSSSCRDSQPRAHRQAPGPGR